MIVPPLGTSLFPYWQGLGIDHHASFLQIGDFKIKYLDSR